MLVSNAATDDARTLVETEIVVLEKLSIIIR